MSDFILLCRLFMTWRTCMIEPIKNECNHDALLYMKSFINASLVSVTDNLYCNTGNLSIQALCYIKGKELYKMHDYNYI